MYASLIDSFIIEDALLIIITSKVKTIVLEKQSEHIQRSVYKTNWVRFGAFHKIETCKNELFTK